MYDTLYMMHFEGKRRGIRVLRLWFFVVWGGSCLGLVGVGVVGSALKYRGRMDDG